MSVARRLAGRLRRRASTLHDSPGDEAPLTDPLLEYEALRESGPVVEVPGHGWIVLGLDEAKAVMKDPAAFSNRPYEPVDIALLSASPPRHGDVRRVIAPLLSPAVIDDARAFMARRSAELVRTPLEIVTEFVRPLSRGMTAQLMGFDDADTAALLEANRAADAMPVPIEGQFAAVDAVAAHCRAHQTLSRDASDVLSPAEIDSFMRLLWVASTTTSERLLTFCVLRLLHDEPLRRRVSGDPDLVPAFIDEVTRLHPPEPMILREAMVDRAFGPVTIPAGAIVRLCLPAVNRDPGHFDEPSELRLDRPPGRHLAFGTGPHTCLGAGLSRKTIPLAVGALLDGLPDLRSLDPELPPLGAYAPERLLVTG